MKRKMKHDMMVITNLSCILQITMSTILEKIAEIEAEMARTQKNKATAGHLGMLKAKLAKLRRELITPKSQGGGTGEGKKRPLLLSNPY